MSALHLVRIPFDLAMLTRFAIKRDASDDDLGYAMHLALRSRYGAAAPQPWRLFTAGRAGPHLLGYAADAEGLAEAAALPPVDPLLADLFTGPPQAQPMPEHWRTGARYRFEVRVRPLVRFGKTRRAARAAIEGSWQRRAGEIDAFVAAAENAEGAPLDRETIYRDWLARRFEGAALLETASARLIRRVSTRRSRHDGGKAQARTESPEAVFEGELTVADGDRFAHLLQTGVGRHTAFGFGMITLAPPGRRSD